MENEETMFQYVQRKLRSDAFNKAEVWRQTGIRKSTLSEIISGKNVDPLNSTVQKLYDYFQEVCK
jgi:hypothetical protein